MTPMDDTALQRLVTARIEAAISYTDDRIGTDNAKAMRYYRGDVSEDLPTVEGRSSVVSRDLRDTVQAIMPSLTRIFLSSEKPVEFAPVGPEDMEAAEQATDFVRFVCTVDNAGFSTLYDAMKAGLYQKPGGIVKAWWDESAEVTAQRFEGVDEATMQAHGMDPDAEIIEHETDGLTHSYTVKRVTRKGKARIEGVPADEFLIAGDARSFDRPSLIGHKTTRRVGELVAMGYDFDQMLELASDEGESEEETARNVVWSHDDDADNDPAMREVVYVEAYMLVDADGDGILEMRKVCTAGEQYKILQQEIVSDHPFAVFCPEPMPHTAVGENIHDSVADIQRIRSNLMRLALDGIAQVVTPRLQVDPTGQVDLKTLLDNRIGGVVIGRTGSITPLMTDKAAPQAAMEAWRAMGEVLQSRTGQNSASMGLEADALQSTSRIAANALVQSAQSRVEMIARIYAETGFKRLYKLVLRLVTQHQDRERVIRLRNKWVPMDPRAWSPDMDVTVNVGLGHGNVEERAMFLQSFLQIQQAAMQQLGPQNPLVNIDKVRNTLEDLCELGGKVPERYLVSAEEWAQVQQQMAQQPQQPPKPDPAEIIAQAEVQKVQAQIARDNAQAQFEQQRELLKDDRERDKVEADIVIRCLEKGINPDAVLTIIRQQRQATPSVIPGGMQ